LVVTVTLRKSCYSAPQIQQEQPAHVGETESESTRFAPVEVCQLVVGASHVKTRRLRLGATARAAETAHAAHARSAASTAVRATLVVCPQTAFIITRPRICRLIRHFRHRGATNVVPVEVRYS